LINPLNIPWKSEEEEEKPKKKKPPDEFVPPPFLGVQNEASKEATDPSAVVFIISGVQGYAPGEYKVAYEEGLPLKHYLSKLNMRHVLSKSAVYDTNNLENGRCRQNYIPGPGAVLRVGNPNVGMASHLQRSNVDAMRSARNMGGREVEVSLSYSQTPKGKLDIEQF